MRRAEREVTNFTSILHIIDSCQICRIGMEDEKGIYIVPVNFGFEIKGEAVILYFHSASEGRKYQILINKPKVCIEMDNPIRVLNGGSIACRYGMAYESVIGTGIAEKVDNKDEKKRALDILMKRVAGKEDYEYDLSYMEKVSVFKIVLSDISAKRNL